MACVICNLLQVFRVKITFVQNQENQLIFLLNIFNLQGFLSIEIDQRFMVSATSYKASNEKNFLWIIYADFSRYKVIITAQPVITCSKLTIETLEQGVKYVQS